MSDRDTLDVLRGAAVWFEPNPDGFGSLLDAIGGARLVLIGEASHGTHEFYRTRAELTKALVLRKGFSIVAVEADWPDAYRANRWVRGISRDPDAETALGDFTRFPRWMWRNRDVSPFSNGCVVTMPPSTPQPVSDSTDWTFTAFTPPSKPSWPICARSIRLAPNGRATGTGASRTFEKTRRPTATRPRSASRVHVKTMLWLS